MAQPPEADLDPVAIFNRAQDLHEKGDLKGALLLYEKALGVVPEFPEAEYQRGIAYLALNDIDSAEKAFRRSVDLRPGWAVALNSLGSVLIRRGEFVEASKVLRQVLEDDPYNPAALTALTEIHLRSNADPAVIKELLSKLTVTTSKANPTLSQWTARAALETALKLNDAARSTIAKILSIDPENALGLSLLGEISLVDGDIEKAREVIARLDRIKGPSIANAVLKAKVLAYDGRYDEAVAILDTIRSDMPDVSALRERINTARTTSPAALELQLKEKGDNPGILGRLCSLYRRDDPAKAIDYCRRASAVEPGNIQHAVGFGAALVQARDFESAIRVLTKLKEIAPENATVRANLATSLFQSKRYAEAKAEFEWLTKEHPASAGAYFFLGVLHDQLSEYADAAANYQQYLRLADPVNNKIDIDRVNLRLPQLVKLIRDGKGKKRG